MPLVSFDNPRCFQGVSKETSGMRWVKQHVITSSKLKIETPDPSTYNNINNKKLRMLPLCDSLKKSLNDLHETFMTLFRALQYDVF